MVVRGLAPELAQGRQPPERLRGIDGTAIAGTCASDVRLKTDIRPLAGVLGRVARLRPVQYRWRAEEFPERHFEMGIAEANTVSAAAVATRRPPAEIG